MLGAEACTSVRTAEVLCANGWVSVGNYGALAIGDVFRSRDPDGSYLLSASGTAVEVCRVAGAPKRRPDPEHPELGFCWEVEVDVLDLEDVLALSRERSALGG